MPKENQLGILEISSMEFTHLLLEIQQRASGPGESAAGVTYQYLKIHPKSCRIFPLKVVASYWFMEGCSWSIVVTQLRPVSRLYANNSSPGIYWRKRPNWQAHLELCHRNPDIVERALNRTALSNSTMGKCASIQVIKQPEHGRTSATKEQKWSSFQTIITDNNSNSFANKSKLIIRNNLGLYKHSDIYLIYNFQKHYHGSNGVKI